MAERNMATKIESGVTTVTDKWTVIKIILCILVGASLIGCGVGYYLGMFVK